MAQKSKIFFIFFFSIVFIATSVSFYKYFILKDYYIEAEVECEPEKEKCFIIECDPSVDSECPENLDERISYYKLVKKKAYDIPLCDSNFPDCQPFACQAGQDCKEIFCDRAAETEDVQCNDPEIYIREHSSSEGQINQENPEDQDN